MPLLALVSVVLFSSAGNAESQARKLAQDDVVQLLVGNSIKGKDQRGQYFEQAYPDATNTRGQFMGRRVVYGSWSVNRSGLYCEVWDGSKSCYEIFHASDDKYELRGEGRVYSITVVRNKMLIH
ncbi:MAG: hypothetical protein H6906_13515 [Hyphomicrobiales bacterium]|nr:hypothetical protein [Hyphomicrobiales bacterium]